MILVIIMYFLFASTFTIGKAALAYVSPFLFTGIRMTLGGSILLGYAYKNAKRRWFFDGDDYALFARIIIFHIFCAYTLEFWALEYVTSAKACLLYSLSPFITAVFSYFLFSEQLSIRQVCGLTIGFLGFIPILIAQTPIEEMTQHIGFLSCYEIALILSVIASAYGWMIMKKLVNKGYSFIVVNGVGMTGGGILAFLFSIAIEGFPVLKNTPVVISSVAQYYGVFTENILMLGIYSLTIVIIANIIGYNLYAYLLSRYSATFLSFAGFVTPLFTAVLGWVFLDEEVTWHFFATMIIIVYGLYLFHGKKEIEFEEKGL
jgi:drug/metabolite transporter (DMT)-like permease